MSNFRVHQVFKEYLLFSMNEWLFQSYYKLVISSSLTPQNHDDRNRSQKSLVANTVSLECYLWKKTCCLLGRR